MNSHVAAQIVLLGIFVCLIGVWWRIAYLERRDVLFVLSRHAFKKPTKNEIRLALSGINAHCPRYTFGIERSANIIFRGRQICLVYGPVGRLTPSKFGLSWNNATCLYALFDDNQVEWAQANGDVFSVAHFASPYSAFWVKMRGLKADMALQQIPAKKERTRLHKKA